MAAASPATIDAGLILKAAFNGRLGTAVNRYDLARGRLSVGAPEGTVALMDRARKRLIGRLPLV
jgi:hypothetical protein